MTAPLQVELSDDPAVLRSEVVRLRDELARALQTSEPERDVESSTDWLALQQEVDTLRQSLREKDRVVDVTTAQCTLLEEELEDQRLAYDALKRDLERKKRSLADLQQEAASLGSERRETKDSDHAPVDTGEPVSVARNPPAEARLERPRGTSPVNAAKTFVAGLSAGVLVAAAAVLLVRSDLIPVSHTLRQGADAPGPPASVIDQAAPAHAPRAVANPDAVAGDAKSDTPEVMRSVRDSLRDGTSGPLMAVIKSGRFTMGKLRALSGDDQAPAHPVDLKGFLIGVTEVTFEDYDRFVRATGGRFPGDYGWGRGRRPVVDVSWDDARAYTRWLSGQTGKRYRIPSEAEWEYAAAAGRRSTFWWGYQRETGRAVCFDCGTQWDNRSTAPAGSFDPNPLGLYDTAGNAMEWVADCYLPNYVGAPADGAARIAQECSYRVARGGAFNKPARSMGSRVRHRFDPGTRLNMLGFRLARDE